MGTPLHQSALPGGSAAAPFTCLFQALQLVSSFTSLPPEDQGQTSTPSPDGSNTRGIIYLKLHQFPPEVTGQLTAKHKTAVHSFLLLLPAFSGLQVRGRVQLYSTHNMLIIRAGSDYKPALPSLTLSSCWLKTGRTGTSGILTVSSYHGLSRPKRA